jgi:hypothetical protein
LQAKVAVEYREGNGQWQLLTEEIATKWVSDLPITRDQTSEEEKSCKVENRKTFLFPIDP